MGFGSLQWKTGDYTAVTPSAELNKLNYSSATTLNYYRGGRTEDEEIKHRKAMPVNNKSEQKESLTSEYKFSNGARFGNNLSSFSDSEKKNNSFYIGGKSRGASTSKLHAAHMTADMEAQNDDLIEELHGKVLDLKQIAFGMRDQVQESNTLLDQMGGAMIAAGGLLSGTMRRLQKLTSFRTGRHIWIMMIFFVVVLFLLYLFFGKRR